MTITYTPAFWFWQIGADATKFYSSAAVAYVASVPAGFTATRIASEQELWDVLSKQGVSLPATAVISDARKTEQLTALDVVTLRIAFNHENRIRALESKAPITLAQFTAAVKGLLPDR